ncbi:MAG: hypothetical protein U1E76_06725 [Planctomycetota bacterium]
MVGIRALAAGVAGILVFVLAIQLLKKGAGGLGVLHSWLHVEGILDTLGFGWIMAYVMMSGSPVAAMALTLYEGGVLEPIPTFAMITGSRLGASFFVLLIGFVYHLRGRQRSNSIAIGVVSLLVTTAIYLPALALGYVLLRRGWLDGIQLGAGARLGGIIGATYDPIVAALAGVLDTPVLFLVGAGTLLLAFKILDRALPEIDPERSSFHRIAEFVYRPEIMFLLGLGMTCITLSVSVSLTVLVPLAARGLVRRENVIPYIMGANITTFVDTMFAALLLHTPAGATQSPFTIVFAQVASVSLCSLVVLAFFYRRFQAAINQLMNLILRDRRTLTWFVVVIMIVPLALLFTHDHARLVAIDELGTSAQTLAMARLLCAHPALDVTLLASAPSAAIAERLLVRAVIPIRAGSAAAPLAAGGHRHGRRCGAPDLPPLVLDLLDHRSCGAPRLNLDAAWLARRERRAPRTLLGADPARRCVQHPAHPGRRVGRAAQARSGQWPGGAPRSRTRRRRDRLARDLAAAAGHRRRELRTAVPGALSRRRDDRGHDAAACPADLPADGVAGCACGSRRARAARDRGHHRGPIRLARGGCSRRGGARIPHARRHHRSCRA